MTRQQVTDPAILAQLGESPRKKVTDPKLLAQLNAESNEQNAEDPGAYLDTLSGKPAESFLSKLPRNILIGLAHAGRNLHNLPHDVVKTAEFLGGSGEHPLSSYLPNDTEDYSSAFGGDQAKDTLMDKLIKGGIEYAPDLIGAKGLIKAGVGRLKGTHYLSQVEKAAQESGHAFHYSPASLEEAKSYLPKSHATKEMIEASESGNYPASFAIQSQIGKHQRDLAKSFLPADRLLSPQVGDLKQSMLGELGSLLESHGMKEEAALLRKGINNNRQYHQLKNVIKKYGIPTSVAGAGFLGYRKAKKLLAD